MENEELVREYQAGNEDVIEEIINKNYGLITSFLRKKFPAKSYNDDYIQEGMIGIIEAVKRFDFHKNIKFSTYATIWIRQKIFRFYYYDKLIRVPEYNRDIDDFEIVSDEFVILEDTFDDLLFQHECIGIINKELCKLCKVNRLIFYLLNVKGEKVQKIAQEFKIEKDDVINIDKRIKTHLRKVLKDNGY